MPYKATDLFAAGDAGLIVSGKNLEELFSDAAIGLMQIMTNVDELMDSEVLSFEIDDDNIEDLYFKWLSDIIYYKDTEEFLIKRCRLVFEENEKIKLKAKLFGEKINPEKHTLKVDVKAVTYYRFKIEKKDNQWYSEVVFDL